MTDTSSDQNLQLQPNQPLVSTDGADTALREQGPGIGDAGGHGPSEKTEFDETIDADTSSTTSGDWQTGPDGLIAEKIDHGGK